MLDLDQRRQCEIAIVEAQVGRTAHGPRPRADPPPKRKLGVPLESPLVRRPHKTAPRGAVVEVVLEEPVQHIHVSEVAERLAGCAEFDVVVWRGGRRAEQPEGKPPVKLRDLLAAAAVEILKDGRFVVRRSREVGGVEQMQALVVGDGDAAMHAPVAAHAGVDAELLGLALKLCADGQRSLEQHVPVRPTHDVFRPHQLL
ncbi:MAG: hypothetical protein LBF61_12525 [Azoarcus sp.]|jgi:hypothetical protein|nr:hypothetical protein [Azoarcus sp.]